MLTICIQFILHFKIQYSKQNKYKVEQTITKMFEKCRKRPQTSNYRNQSQIVFGEQTPINQPNCFKQFPKKKRPASFRNISKVAQFMNDDYKPSNDTEQISYINVIQNTNKSYIVPRKQTINHQKESQFKQFLQRNGNKLYKPVDQFSEYADLIKKNSTLLRRGQFDMPLGKQQFSIFKRSQTQKISSLTNSKYYRTKWKNSNTKSHFGNTISSTLQQSIKKRTNLKKQKEEFRYQTQKYIKPMNKTFLGYANEYEDLLQKQRYRNDKIPLNNSMNRVLTMEVMGKQIQNMTHLYS